MHCETVKKRNTQQFHLIVMQAHSLYK